MSSESDRRKQVMLGDLPPAFLQLGGEPTSGRDRQIAADAEVAQALQFQQGGGVAFPTQTMGCISITVVQARLTKNYGIVRMDPYCRITVGTSIMETQTSGGGGKSPRWNKTFRCFVPRGVDSIYLEIFDEKAFTTDDRVAWTHVKIPEIVFSGETVNDWYILSGKQGENKEGSIQLSFSFSNQPLPQPIVYPAPQIMVIPGPSPYYPQQTMPVATNPMYANQHQVCQQPPRPMYTEEDVSQIKDMFPDNDVEVIKSVLEANRGNKDATINSLLSMQS